MSKKQVSILANVQNLATLQEPQDELSYTRSYFAAKDIRANALRRVDLKSRRHKQSDIETRFFFDYRQLVSQLRAIKQAKEDEIAKRESRAARKIEYSGFSEKQMERALAIFFQEKSDEEFNEIVAQLAFDPSLGDKPILDLMNIWCESPTVLDTVCVKHFIWQVKRKLAGLDIKWELWVNFFGPQGKGKTWFLKKMMNPLRELKEELKIHEIATDDRFMFLLQQAYVIMFEELQFANKASMESIKAIMSKTELSWRRLGKNAQDVGYNNSTFISSSNKSIAEVFYDPTGMRRFYEVNVRAAFDHDAVNSFDYYSMWKCIDETKESPVVEHLEALLAHQKEHLTQKDTIELFLEEYGIQPAEEGTGYEVKGATFYQQYANFCLENGYKNPFANNTFAMRLLKMSFIRKRKTHGVHYLISKTVTNTAVTPRTYTATADN